MDQIDKEIDDIRYKPDKKESKGLRRMVMSGAGISLIFILSMIGASAGVIYLYEILASWGI